MFLSQLVGKEIVVGSTPRGVVKGIGVSLKTYKVKYLLCTGVPSHTLFAFSISAVSSIGDCVILHRLRPLLPKHCACIFLQLPIYSFEGEYVGNIQDLAIHNFTATTLYADENTVFPISNVAACSDALLLKKEQPYPLGQRIPAPFLSTFSEKNESVVTKPILRTAIEKKSLIKLTLSLPPFFIDSL